MTSSSSSTPKPAADPDGPTPTVRRTAPPSTATMVPAAPSCPRFLRFPQVDPRSRGPEGPAPNRDLCTRSFVAGADLRFHTDAALHLGARFGPRTWIEPAQPWQPRRARRSSTARWWAADLLTTLRLVERGVVDDGLAARDVAEQRSLSSPPARRRTPCRQIAAGLGYRSQTMTSRVAVLLAAVGASTTNAAACRPSPVLTHSTLPVSTGRTSSL
jgi:hypothetical protein